MMMPPDDQRAWAAGFFDGEGCFSLNRTRAVATISQVDCEVLDRFYRIVGCGGVYGPVGPYGRLKKPFYCWRIGARADFDRVLQILWPWLGSIKRADAERVAAGAGPGGNAQSRKTHCPQGHPYDEQNTRWVKRSRDATTPTIRQCRTCHKQRNAANWARIKKNRNVA